MLHSYFCKWAIFLIFLRTNSKSSLNGTIRWSNHISAKVILVEFKNYHEDPITLKVGTNFSPCLSRETNLFPLFNKEKQNTSSKIMFKNHNMAHPKVADDMKGLREHHWGVPFWGFCGIKGDTYDFAVRRLTFFCGSEIAVFTDSTNTVRMKYPAAFY